MKIKDILNVLESVAPPGLQEDYDNAGLLTGNRFADCTGVLCCLDATEAIIEEAVRKGCNLVVAHHPIIFRGLKQVTGSNYIERTIIKAIKNDISVYAIHTNLDNILSGVNGRIAQILELTQCEPLVPKAGLLKKLYTFVPTQQAEKLRNAIFEAGAGHIGNYSECSFNTEGTGTFKGGEDTHPFAGHAGTQHREAEIRIEIIFPAWLQDRVVNALIAAHPYEEPAYDIIQLDNSHPQTGSGLTGLLPQPMEEQQFLERLKEAFGLKLIKHTALRGKPVRRVAVCGGSGSFLLRNAIASGSDVYISSDFKYHEYFDADNQIVIADIGHYESERFTIDLLYDIIIEKFPTFAVLKTDVNTNPVFYHA
ncbi:MAG: Nif3-like dinuclear metal center hexameric protein [Chitinophagaceae bacterium]|nr:Nif3-like dinuclear metal center hexameric protein [Chitinophagaceae bacterium]MCW5929436.1 Nif3-like dinuclear metal center hexameric protein [Chitinophagaceae bacterium]